MKREVIKAYNSSISNGVVKLILFGIVVLIRAILKAFYYM